MIHKKQLFTICEDICRINDKEWNNPHGSYKDEVESAYQIEEALEGFDDLKYLAEELSYEGEPTPKELSRQIIDSATVDVGTSEISDVDRFDKALDAIYFAIGSLHKLGLRPDAIVDGLQIVHNANKQKAGAKDDNGKVIKPTDFVCPEDELQKLLNRRY